MGTLEALVVSLMTFEDFRRARAFGTGLGPGMDGIPGASFDAKSFEVVVSSFAELIVVGVRFSESASQEELCGGSFPRHNATVGQGIGPWPSLQCALTLVVLRRVAEEALREKQPRAVLRAPAVRENCPGRRRLRRCAVRVSNLAGGRHHVLAVNVP